MPYFTSDARRIAYWICLAVAASAFLGAIFKAVFRYLRPRHGPRGFEVERKSDEPSEKIP